jgi:hypothetical protein
MNNMKCPFRTITEEKRTEWNTITTIDWQECCRRMCPFYTEQGKCSEIKIYKKPIDLSAEELEYVDSDTVLTKELYDILIKDIINYCGIQEVNRVKHLMNKAYGKQANFKNEYFVTINGKSITLVNGDFIKVHYLYNGRSETETGIFVSSGSAGIVIRDEAGREQNIHLDRILQIYKYQ